MKLKILTLVMFSLLIGCSSKKDYYRNPLVKQILKPRPNHIGLTNRACEKWNGDKCENWVVIDYDLNDAGLRKKLVELKFICKIHNNRFKICLDKAGFCRHTYKKVRCNKWDKWKWFCKKKKVLIKYIPISDYQYVLDSGTRCYNRDEYNF